MEHLRLDFRLQLYFLDFGFNTSAPLFNTSVLFCPDRLALCLQTYQLVRKAQAVVSPTESITIYITETEDQVPTPDLQRHLKSETVISIYTCLEKKAF